MDFFTPPLDIVIYTAGIFDGEGTISLGKQHKTNGIVLRASISSTDIDFLYRIRQDWGNLGSIYVRKAVRRPKQKIEGSWRMSSQQVRHFLALLEPYLRIKRDRARLVLDIPERKKGHPYTEEDFSVSAYFKSALTDMNRRGVQETH